MSAPRSHAEGILFDTAYLEPDIHIWVRTVRGELLCVSTPFYPVFYLAGPRAVVEDAVEAAVKTAVARGGAGNSAGKNGGGGVVQPLGWTSRTEFWSGRPRRVMAMRALLPSRVVGLVRGLLHANHRLSAYDVDLDPTLVFHASHRLFPLARIALSHREGRLLSVRALDDPGDPAFRLPPLKILTLRLTESPLISLERGNAVRAEAGGESCLISRENTAEGLRALNRLVARHDPDVIDSVRGDQVIFPWLLTVARENRIALRLDRMAPQTNRRVVRRGRSIVVYGQTLFKAAAYPLLGRWHLDRENSFFIREAGIEGLVELARLSRLPVQRQARTSGGTAMTAMEIDLALRQGILVPFIKDQVESFRPVSDLLRDDKGGLSYFPPEGLWERVIELDFQQQYPTIMAIHNISPETVDCPCCPGINPVPGVAHHTCSRRRGLVPQALAALLDKRLKYKRLLKTVPPEEIPRYDARQSAIKWTLVTTFGYQGFKSAKFGHIAAHEAITAWGRESLLVAKETFEAAGYRLLHALTDSIYVTKPGFAREEVERLAEKVRERTGLTLAIEGVYDWICFPPSKVRDGLSVSTRYFGRFEGGTLKLRGLKTRQHSTPPFVRAAQHSFLNLMSECRSVAGLKAAAPRLRGLYRQKLRELWSGRVPLEELLITIRISREPQDYRARSAGCLCLNFLAGRGITIPPGQKIKYVILDKENKNPARRYLPVPFLHLARDYDARAYQALLQDAFKEVTIHIPGAAPIFAKPENLSLW